MHCIYHNISTGSSYLFKAGHYYYISKSPKDGLPLYREMYFNGQTRILYDWVTIPDLGRYDRLTMNLIKIYSIRQIAPHSIPAI